MKKVRLDVETLAVDSFPTAERYDESGTVQGFGAPTPPYETCGCTTGGSYLAVLCPPPSTKTTCRVD
jgi:hypothetical protein